MDSNFGCDNFLVGKIQDIVNSDYINFTKFLSPNEKMLARKLALSSGVKFSFFGGMDNCEKEIMAVVPDYISTKVEYPIDILNISFVKNKFAKELCHRDYLGALLGLGIKRELIGDIFTNENGAYIMSHQNISEYIIDNLDSVGRNNVSCKIDKLENLVFEQKYIEKFIIVASNRIDAISSSVFNLSRQQIKQKIESGYVLINGQIVFKTEKLLNDNDVVSIRGFGKFKVSQFIGNTKKDRLKVNISIYK